MTVREILKMGDPRLLRIAAPVTAFDTPEVHALIADMRETMASVHGAGLAAPQIGVNLQLVIFGGASVIHATQTGQSFRRQCLSILLSRLLVMQKNLIGRVVYPYLACEAKCLDGRMFATPVRMNAANL